jgi:hypothetical protein
MALGLGFTSPTFLVLRPAEIPSDPTTHLPGSLACRHKLWDSSLSLHNCVYQMFRLNPCMYISTLYLLCCVCCFCRALISNRKLMDTSHSYPFVLCLLLLFTLASHQVHTHSALSARGLDASHSLHSDLHLKITSQERPLGPPWSASCHWYHSFLPALFAVYN